MDKISDVITSKAALVFEEFQLIQAGKLKKEDAINTQELMRKSQAAIFGGRQDPAWRTYMELFVGDNPANIDRLIPPAPDPDPKREEALERARCYLVRNGRCSEGTTPNMLNTVETTLD
jgi:hypothetical protein